MAISGSSVEFASPAIERQAEPAARHPAAAGAPCQAIVLLPGAPLSGAAVPAALQPILGRSPLQRHLYHLAQTGARRCCVVLAPGATAADLEAECRRQAAEIPVGTMEVVVVRAAAVETEDVGGGEGLVQMAHADVVVDPRLYRWLGAKETSGVLVTGPARRIGLGQFQAREIAASVRDHGYDGLMRLLDRPDVARVGVESLPTYVPGLRRHLDPYWQLVRTSADQRRVERLILDSAQKGVLDFPARYLHPWPENTLARLLTGTRITPNHITVVTAVVAFYVTYLFAERHFLAGLLIALVVNVLDGVDGKLARIRLQTSRLGDRLDHFLDVTFEFSWYLGLGFGLAGADRVPVFLAMGLIGLMIASRALSGVYMLVTGHQIHDHLGFDRAFRLVAGRRNIYVLLLLGGLAAGRLETAFHVVFWWAVATALIYALRIAAAALVPAWGKASR